jgi:hypothetical protein
MTVTIGPLRLAPGQPGKETQVESFLEAGRSLVEAGDDCVVRNPARTSVLAAKLPATVA